MNRKKLRTCLLVNWLLVLLVALPGQAVASDEAVKIVALGDSLTASYGLSPGEGFVSQLQVALDSRGHKVTIINAGVSGDTASGGLAFIAPRWWEGRRSKNRPRRSRWSRAGARRAGPRADPSVPGLAGLSPASRARTRRSTH